MRVLICSNNFSSPVNGPAIFTRLCLELADNNPGVELVKVLTEDVYEQNKQVFKLPLKASKLFPPLGMLLRNIDYYLTVRTLVKKYNFDSVLFVNAVTGVLTGLAFRGEGLNILGMINDDSSAVPGGTSGIGRYSYMRRWLFRQFERFSFKVNDRIIVNSYHLQQVLISAYRQRETTMPVMYKAIDLSNFRFSPRAIAEDQVIKILFVKTDFIRGGLKVLIDSLLLLPDYKFELIAIGPDKERHRYLHDLVKSEAVSLKLLGSQSREVVYRYMMDSHIFCVPAYQEALGVANIEALACGLPVVYSRIGGVPEVMNYGLNGWGSEKGDRQSLATAIHQCISSPEERCQKVIEGRKFVERNFSKQKMLARLTEILKVNESR